MAEDNQQSSPLPSPSHSSITKKTEEPESGADVCGRPSPVSVLDTPFLEDDISPGYSRFHPGKNSCTRAMTGLSGNVLKLYKDKNYIFRNLFPIVDT